MQDRFVRRIDALRAILEAEGEGAAALLVAGGSNVTYLTGFTGDSSFLLVTPDRAVLVSDGRYTEQIARECPGLETSIRPVGTTQVVGIADAVRMLGAREIAFESAHLTVAQHLELKEKVPGARWRGVVLWVEKLRIVKDEFEIAAIREAIDIAERAYERLRENMSALRAMSEKDVADELEFLLRRSGAIGAAFPPIISAGPNSGLPHARPSPEARLGDFDFTLVDWGAAGKLYKSDLTRMIVTGPMSERFRDVYCAVLDAQIAAIGAIRPGRTSREIDRVARDSLNAAGFGELFTHSLGHGIGLDLHEVPALGREPDFTLQPGMIFTVEPGVYVRGWGGIRIEDMVLVTAGGCEVLTHVGKDLDAIGVT